MLTRSSQSIGQHKTLHQALQMIRNRESQMPISIQATVQFQMRLLSVEAHLEISVPMLRVLEVAKARPRSVQELCQECRILERRLPHLCPQISFQTSNSAFLRVLQNPNLHHLLGKAPVSVMLKLDSLAPTR
ncbi:unnamed protein product [Rodentolepis nana]|uniref:Uncharacterized protein n=1 Tax=Rodentolepis nana TaxID=102285 RepID=A0A3P7T556_RODNA|nr:unnamed protein product [Rodentolepis nana]